VSWRTQHERELAEYNALPFAPYTTVKISARRWIVVQFAGSSRTHGDPYRTRTITVPEEARWWRSLESRSDKAQHQMNYADATQLARDLNEAWHKRPSLRARRVR
jgi:hypothetical protein